MNEPHDRSDYYCAMAAILIGYYLLK